MYKSFLAFIFSISFFSVVAQVIKPITGISTNFGIYWSTTTAVNNPIRPNDSHELLSFTYDGVTYSTGVNDGRLNINLVNYVPGNYRAIPVAGLLGSLASNTTSTLLAMASLKDGNPTQGVSTHPNINGKTIRDVLIDGVRGLDLGTGVTNLPVSSVMTFGIQSIKETGIADVEPDILITQIAQPGAANTDTYSFIDLNGAIIGNAITQTQSSLSQLGEYRLDLFSLTAGPLTNAKPWGGLFETANGTRPIRMSAYRLSDFGITAANASQIVSFRINPSGTSDLAFVGYNANSINFRPAISIDPGNSLTDVCAGGTAIMRVIATPANEGVLTYRWEQKIGAVAWTPVSNGGSFSGATTSELRVSNPTATYQYRCVVTESGLISGLPFSYESTSTEFTISINASIGNPTILTQPTNASGCAGNPFNLFTVASGGTGVYTYQWYSGASSTGPYTLINGATSSNYSGTISSPGPAYYRVIISNDGCSGSVTSNTVTVTTTGAGTVLTSTNGSRCGTGIVNLSASSTNGGTFSWRDGNGAEVSTLSTFSPSISVTTNYFVTATLNGCTTPASTVTATINLCVISGTVFQDANGGTVGGVGTNAGATYVSFVNGGTVNANANGTSTISGGSIVATVPVAANGTYTSQELSAGTYNLVLHNTVGGSSTTAVNAGWVNTGEGIGPTPTPTDGLPNGIIAVTFLNAAVSNVNFGIEQRPETSDVIWNITTAPDVNGFDKPLNANTPYILGGFSDFGPQQFAGSDPEDSPLPNSITGGIGSSFAITTLPSASDAILFYDADGIGGNPPVAVVANIPIPNFNPSLLTIVFQRLNLVTTSFTYSTVDAAGVFDNSPATYTINLLVLLPVTGLQLKGNLVPIGNMLEWSTLTERNTQHFTVQKSTNGQQFSNIAKVPAIGNSSTAQQYSFTDIDRGLGVAYYRVVLVDKDNRLSTSNTIAILPVGSGNVMIFPNPARQLITISSRTAITRYTIRDLSGRVILERGALGNNMITINLPLNMLSGLYIIETMDKNHVSVISKFSVR